MENLCHRCGNVLREGEIHCPHCGAPQLVVEAGEPGAVQQPVIRLQGEAHRVQWRVAITSALLMALPLGLLSGLAGTSLFIVSLGTGVVTLWLYQRRSPGLSDGRIGWRIGSMLGAAAALVASAVYAVKMLVQRYLMHGGGAIDSEFQGAARQAIDVWKRSNAQPGAQTQEMVHAMKMVSAFLLSPDGHAAMQLLLALTMSAGILLFASLGGALGGWWQATRGRAQRGL